MAIGDFDAAFYAGRHGPLRDLAENETSIGRIQTPLANGKPVAEVCHAPGVLRHVAGPDLKPVVDGKNVTGFANSEEQAASLTEGVPFLVEDLPRAHGGVYSKAADWQPQAVVDGLLIT